MPDDILNSENLQTLVTKVEEAARSSEEGVKHFIEPAQGTLRRAVNKRHHIVFGRRGSGKSSLLRKAAADLTTDRRPIADVNLEAFKGHSYPDVLLSVLISTFREFKHWIETAAINPAHKTTFWQRLFGTKPARPAFNRKQSGVLAERLKSQIEDLETQLHAAEQAQLKVTTSMQEETRKQHSVGAAGKSAAASLSLDAQSSSAKARREETEEQYRRNKVDFLHRHIMDYQQLFREMSVLSSGDSYLFLDDLYHIKRADQPQLIDYFHRIAKDHNLWLKIGTIRHRSSWYLHGDPPIGIKLGDDADQIDLDITLEKYSVAKDFLLRILANFASECNISTGDLMTDGAADRLVLASGDVARDFLSVFRMSVDVARERTRAGTQGGEKINVEDVNVAAGEYDGPKREEFKRDTLEDDQDLDSEFQTIRDFCLEEANSNCFLLGKDAKGSEVALIHELVDLKLLHLVRSRVTVSGRRGKIFEAYMLDLSQYAGARKRRGLEMIEFWKPGAQESLRKASLIYEVGAKAA
jgi:hypothetical protein